MATTKRTTIKILLIVFFSLNAVESEKTKEKKKRGPYDFFDEDDFFSDSSNRKTEYKKKDGEKKEDDFFSGVDFYGVASNKDLMYGPFSYLTDEMSPSIPDPPKYKSKPTTTPKPPPPPPPPPKKQPYAFAYGVRDADSGTNFKRSETSDGKGKTGQYKVHLPDGRIQTVNYVADHNGFKADIQYNPIEKPNPNSIPKSHPKEQQSEKKEIKEVPPKAESVKVTEKIEETSEKEVSTEEKPTATEKVNELNEVESVKKEERSEVDSAEPLTVQPGENSEQQTVSPENVPNDQKEDVPNPQTANSHKIVSSPSKEQESASLKDMPGPPYSLPVASLRQANAGSRQPQNVAYATVMPNRIFTKLQQPPVTGASYRKNVRREAQRAKPISNNINANKQVQRENKIPKKTREISPAKQLPNLSVAAKTHTPPPRTLTRHAAQQPGSLARRTGKDRFKDNPATQTHFYSPALVLQHEYMKTGVQKQRTPLKSSNNQNNQNENTKFLPTVLPLKANSIKNQQTHPLTPKSLFIAKGKIMETDESQQVNNQEILKQPQRLKTTPTQQPLKRWDPVKIGEGIHQTTKSSKMQILSEAPPIHISSTVPTRYQTESSSNLNKKRVYVRNFVHKNGGLKFVSPLPL